MNKPIINLPMHSDQVCNFVAKILFWLALIYTLVVLATG